jgi:hypothetical protein
MIGAIRMGEKPASKDGSLIHFMLFKIPFQNLHQFNLIAKVRLILPNNRIPDLTLGGCPITEGINGIDPASLQWSVPFMFWWEVPRIGARWIRNTTTCNK